MLSAWTSFVDLGLRILGQAETAQTILNPSWITPPDPLAAAEYMPEFANLIGVDGLVTLTCQIAMLGPPGPCVVDAESPQGLGFGVAAVQVAQTGVLSPRMVGGEPAPAVVRTTVRFTAFPLDQMAETAPPPPEVMPSERAIELASQVVQYDIGAIPRVEFYLTRGLVSERREIVHQWIDELLPIDAERTIRIVATTLANFVTEGELEAYVAHGTPFSSTPPTEEQWRRACEWLFSEVDETKLALLRDRYCSQFDCEIAE